MPAIIFVFTSQTGISLSYLVQISLSLILLPALASRAVARIPINPVLPINLGFFLVTYTVIGLNHGALWQGSATVAAIALACTFANALRTGSRPSVSFRRPGRDRLFHSPHIHKTALSLNKGRARLKGRYCLSIKDDLAYLKSIRIFIGLSVFIFGLTTVVGYYAAAVDPELASNWTKELEMLKWILDQPPILIMMIIFLKNLLASAMAMLLGLGLGLIPLLVVTSNGFLLGIVGYATVQKAGWIFLAAGILPHGIIELPVVLISIAIGFRLGYLLALTLAKEKADLSGEIRMAFHFLVRYVAPLLFLAAAIETFITPIAISVVT